MGAVWQRNIEKFSMSPESCSPRRGLALVVVHETREFTFKRLRTANVKLTLEASMSINHGNRISLTLSLSLESQSSTHAMANDIRVSNQRVFCEQVAGVDGALP